jgi:hypothetical protein
MIIRDLFARLTNSKERRNCKRRYQRGATVTTREGKSPSVYTAALPEERVPPVFFSFFTVTKKSMVQINLTS